MFNGAHQSAARTKHLGGDAGVVEAGEEDCSASAQPHVAGEYVLACEMSEANG